MKRVVFTKSLLSRLGERARCCRCTHRFEEGEVALSTAAGGRYGEKKKYYCLACRPKRIP